MSEIDQLMHDTMIKAKSMVLETKSKDEFLAVTASLLAVVQGMYVGHMGSKETAKMFYSIADRLAITKD